MAAKLEAGFAALRITAASAAASAQTATSAEGAELLRLSTNFDDLQAKMMEWTEKAQAQINATGTRAEEIATAVSVVQRESQSHLQAVDGKIGELFSLLQSPGPAAAPIFQSSGPAAAPAPQAQAQPPVDFTANGNDAWTQGREFGGVPMRASIATPPTFDPPRVNGRWALYD